MTSGERPGTTAVHEDRVEATVYSFDTFKIRRFIYQEITILEVSGRYTAAVGKKVERLATQIRSNLGLEVSQLKEIASSFLTPLQRIHKSVTSRRKTFVLCNPPDRLLDLLKLNDLLAGFRISSDAQSIAAAIRAESSAGASEERPRSSRRTRDAAKPIHDLPVSREIEQFNTSIKRTEKLEKGLDSASKCILKILPSTAPSFDGFEFAYEYVPCDKVGGDFFDFIPISDEVLAVTIGDVSGHGLDSAIIMAMAKKIMRLRAHDLADRSAREVLCQVNRDLREELRGKLFLTALFAWINLSTGIVEFARAGHEPPLHFAPETGTPATVIESSGMAIGMDLSGKLFDRALKEARVQLDPEESLLLYTDGIAESWNPRREMFARTRLAYVLERSSAHDSAETILSKLTTAVSQFAQGVPAEDDMTAIVIKRT